MRLAVLLLVTCFAALFAPTVAAAPGNGIVALYVLIPDAWFKEGALQTATVTYVSDGLPTRTAQLNRFGRPRPSVGVPPATWGRSFNDSQYVEFAGNAGISFVISVSGTLRSMSKALPGPGIYYAEVRDVPAKRDDPSVFAMSVIPGPSFSQDCPTAPPVAFANTPATLCSGRGTCNPRTSECTCAKPFDNPVCGGINTQKCQVATKQIPQGNIKPMVPPAGYVFRGSTISECCSFCWALTAPTPCRHAIFNAQDLTCQLINQSVTVWVIGTDDAISSITPPARALPEKTSPLDRPVAFVAGGFALVALVSAFGRLFASAFLQQDGAGGGAGQPGEGYDSQPDDSHNISPHRRSAHRRSFVDLDDAGESGESGAEGVTNTITGESKTFALDDRYHLVRDIGRGAFSCVYLVHRKDDPSALYALKVVQCRTHDEEDMAYKEYAAMRKLQDHPGIVKLHDMRISQEEATEELYAHFAPPGGSTVGPNASYFPMSLVGESAVAHRVGSVDTGAVTTRTSVDSSGRSPPPEGVTDVSPQAGGSTFPAVAQAAPARPAKIVFACFIMTYYPEGTLENGIATDKVFFRQPRTLLSYFQQLSSALAFSHQKGTVHLDLKPGNVLLHDSRRRCVVSDFGLARETNISGNLSNVAGGTLRYQAPEQLRRAPCVASDVWGLACILYAMATGCVGAQTTAMFVQRSHEGFEDMIRETFSAMPPAAVALIVRMFAEEPDARPAMGDVSKAMKVICLEFRKATAGGAAAAGAPAEGAAPASSAPTAVPISDDMQAGSPREPPASQPTSSA